MRASDSASSDCASAIPSSPPRAHEPHRTKPTAPRRPASARALAGSRTDTETQRLVEEEIPDGALFDKPEGYASRAEIACILMAIHTAK
jgi:hypothetical protein